jgi:hypothetical protein
MSSTSLFAELVKKKNLRDLAMKKLAAIKEKEKDGQDGEVSIEAKPDTPATEDVNNIPIPMDNGPETQANPPLPHTPDQVNSTTGFGKRLHIFGINSLYTYN